MERQERRRLVSQLHREGRSLRDIARLTGSSAATCMRDLRVIDHVPAPPPPGNCRAVKHGATSERQLGPMREQMAGLVRGTYPSLDNIRAAILADRLARCELARAWLDERGILRTPAGGDPFPIVDRLDKWENGIERLVGELEEQARAEARERESPHAALAAYLESKGNGDGDSR